MQKHFPIALFTLVQALAACGGSKAPSALTGTAEAALSCETDFDCGSGYRCAGAAEHAYCEQQSSKPSTAHACSNDADCGAGYVCARDVVSPYCKLGPSEPPSNSADAGCAGEYCQNERHGDGRGPDDDRRGDGGSYYSSSKPCTPDAGVAGAGGTSSGGGGNDDDYYSDGHGSDHGSDGADGHGGPGRD